MQLIMNFNPTEGEECNYSVPCALHIYWLRYWKNEDVTVSGYAEGICVM
jgi:hypothetical protein